MKNWVVLILLLGVFGLSCGEVATSCATFFNPQLSVYTPEEECFDLEIRGEIVGSVQSSGHVKRQGPNDEELCIRFEFWVRDGLGIKRARVGLWNKEVPLGKNRFTRKRVFANDPSMVRVDVCLDDIPSETDCCMNTMFKPILVLEARVRMEDGIVRTAGLVPVRPTEARLQVPNVARQGGNGVCSHESISFRACELFLSEGGKDFWACRFNVMCDFIGGFPGFSGINRVDIDEGKIQAVGVPFEEGIDLNQLELSIYEIPLSQGRPTAPPPGGSFSAEALTVISRNPVRVLSTTELMIAEFDVPELKNVNGGFPMIDTTFGFAIALQLRQQLLLNDRLAVRDLQPVTPLLLDFISFSSYTMKADGGGPVPDGSVAADSLFGPPLTNGIFGRIGSVVCGFCNDPETPPASITTEWSSLTSTPFGSLNEGQFPSVAARAPGICLYSFNNEPPELVTIDSPCPREQPRFFTDKPPIKGQVVCDCQFRL
ncbi:hypothetical protein NDN08_004870 [Rhodosorus marinus]|uniref:Uncharacterized protein n=1 Tax=Rhodosorus marinus TaxID=101924 RepID=A0AAV8UEV4_9RHOD|nr:hypothetical protein NDN08_004870 [Rhodosorus marinus]